METRSRSKEPKERKERSKADTMMNKSSKIVGLTKFDGAGYENWKFRFRMLLEFEGLESVLLKPEKVDEQKFLEMDKKAKLLLVGALGDSHLHYVKGSKFVHEVISAFDAIYNQHDTASRVQLKSDFLSHKLTEGGDLETFLAKFDRLLYELELVDYPLLDRDAAEQLLMSMPVSYAITVEVLSLDKSVSLETVKGKLRNQFMKLKLEGKVKSEKSKLLEKTEESGRTIATSFSAKSRIKGNCYTCGKPGHRSVDC